MISTLRSPFAPALLASLLLAPAASAQMPGAGGGAMQEQMMELRQVQQKLEGIREEAMEKPALAKQRKALKEKINAAMAEENPKAEKQMERFEDLRGDFEAAQKAGKKEEAKKLVGELQTLSQSLQKTQAEVMKREEIKSAAQSFQEDLIAQMKEVDPKTEQLMARAQALSQKLRGGMRMPQPQSR